MKILEIREPYWSAWKKYGWKKGVAGVGIGSLVATQAIKEKSNVYLYVGKDPRLYMISTKKITELAKKYNSVQEVGRNRVRVAVVPLTSLMVVQGIRNDKRLTDAPSPRLFAEGKKTHTIGEVQARIEILRQEVIAKRNTKKLGQML